MPSVQGRAFAEKVLSQAVAWIPDSSDGSEGKSIQFNWKRNGAASFPLLAGSMPSKTQVFGTHGHLRLTLPNGMFLVSEVGAGYELRSRDNGSEYVRFSADPFDVDLPDESSFGSSSPAGMDPITIAISCFNLLSGIWQLMHPQISLTLGGDVQVSVARKDQTLVASFNGDCPAIDARAWFLRATLRVVSAELSKTGIRFRFAKNWTGVTYEDIQFQ